MSNSQAFVDWQQVADQLVAHQFDGNFSISKPLLAIKSVTAASVHDVVHAFVKAERYKPMVIERLGGAGWAKQLLDDPDLHCARDNHTRLTALRAIRELLWAEIPVDTVWYQVTFELSRTFDEQQIITPWPTTEVPAHAPEKLNLDNLIAVCHSAADPWTVLEGNHRMSQWRRNASPTLQTSWYVGQTQSLCRWIESDDCPPMHPKAHQLYLEVKPTPTETNPVTFRRRLIQTCVKPELPTVLVQLIDDYLWHVRHDIPLNASTLDTQAVHGLLHLGSPLLNSPEFVVRRNQWSTEFVKRVHTNRHLPIHDGAIYYRHGTGADGLPPLFQQVITLSSSGYDAVTAIMALETFKTTKPLVPIWCFLITEYDSTLYEPDTGSNVWINSSLYRHVHHLTVGSSTDMWIPAMAFPVPSWVAIAPTVLNDALEWNRIICGLQTCVPSQTDLTDYLTQSVAGRQWRQEAIDRNCFLVIWTAKYSRSMHIHDRLYLVSL